MAFPSPLSSNTSFVGSNNVNHVVNLPAVANAGNLLLVKASINGNPTITPPAGWTVILDTNAGGSNKKALVLAKISDGTEGGTTITFVTDAGEQSAHVSFTIDTWSGNLAFIETSGAPVNASSATPNPPSVTASWGADDNLFIACGFLREGATIDTYPTNYTDNQLSATTSTGSAGSTMAVATRNLAAATDDPDAFGITGMFNATPAQITDTIVIRGSIPNVDPQLDTPQADVVIEEGQTGTIAADFSDANNDTLTYNIVPDISLVAGFSFSTVTGDITYDGTQVAAAPISYTRSADDGQGGTPASDTFTVEVIPPRLVIDSVDNATPQPGDQITLTVSNKTSDVTAYCPSGELFINSQDGTTVTLTVPHPLEHGSKTISFMRDEPITLRHGTDRPSINIQIQPETGYQFSQITSIDPSGAYPDLVANGLQVGMYVYSQVLTANTAFDGETGLGAAGPNGGQVRYAIFDER